MRKESNINASNWMSYDEASDLHRSKQMENLDN